MSYFIIMGEMVQGGDGIGGRIRLHLLPLGANNGVDVVKPTSSHCPLDNGILLSNPSPCKKELTPKGVSSSLVGEDGFEPSKRNAADLQSVPFGHSGTPPDIWLICVVDRSHRTFLL